MSDDPNFTVPEASPLRRRLLNIASIVCLVAYVACLGMWIRSYRSYDLVQGRFTDKEVFAVKSVSGRLQLLVHDWSDIPTGVAWPWKFETHQMNDKMDFAFPPRGGSLLISTGFELHPSLKHFGLFVPYWFFVL